MVVSHKTFAVALVAHGEKLQLTVYLHVITYPCPHVDAGFLGTVSISHKTS